MGKQLLIALLLLFVAVVMVAPAAAEATKGDVKLKEGDFGPPDDAPAIKLGETITLEGTLYITDFFGSKVVTGQATVNNTSEKSMFFVYHLALFDKDGNLLGAASQGSFGDEGLAPGEETQLGGLLIKLPPEALQKVASYQATFYEAEEQM